MLANSNTLLSLSLDNPTPLKVSKSPNSTTEIFESELEGAKQIASQFKQAISSDFPTVDDAVIDVVNIKNEKGAEALNNADSPFDPVALDGTSVEQDGNILQPEGNETREGGSQLSFLELNGEIDGMSLSTIDRGDISFYKDEMVVPNKPFYNKSSYNMPTPNIMVEKEPVLASLNELSIELPKAEYDGLKQTQFLDPVSDSQEKTLNQPLIASEVIKGVEEDSLLDDLGHLVDEGHQAFSEVDVDRSSASEYGMTLEEVALLPAGVLHDLNSLDSGRISDNGSADVVKLEKSINSFDSLVPNEDTIITNSMGGAIGLQGSMLGRNGSLEVETSPAPSDEETLLEGVDQLPDSTASLLALVKSETFRKAPVQDTVGSTLVEKKEELLLLDDVPLSDSELLPLLNEGSRGEELSWVLAQMGKSNTKVPSVNIMPPSIVGSDKEILLQPSLAGELSKGSAKILSEGWGTEVSPGEMPVDLDSMVGVKEEVAADETIEFRKKELETMLGRIAMQAEGKETGELRTGGNSALQGVSAIRTASPTTVAQQPNLTMTVPPEHPNWANEITQKVSWVARDGGHTAHIRLDPPELGSLTVKVSVDNDTTTQVSFIAATPQARDLLEGQMNRLRDMLAQQGMDLSKADVDVSQQDASQMQREQGDVGSNGQSIFNEEAEDELIPGNTSYVSASGVDYYA